MASSRKLNVLMISLDTLRADVAYGDHLAAFDDLCARGTVFLNTVSSAPLTPVSHASIMTALQPSEHGIRHLFREQLNTNVTTLAQVLAAAGYRTGAVVSCPGMNRWYGLDRGFQDYDDEIPRLEDGSDPLRVIDVKIRGTALKRAPLVVERGLSWLENNRHDPFFLFLHFFDTHWPYDPPEWFARKDANPYAGEAHYVDHYLGRLFEQISRWGLFENTLIVLFSDHGEDLAGWYANDHAGDVLGYPEEEGHGCLLFDATQMVPLVFVAPGRLPAARRVTSQVRLVDVLPTITDLVGVADESPRAGRSLREFFEGDAPHRDAYCETYYREERGASGDGASALGPWKGLRLANKVKLILDVNTETLMIYDLERDPLERHPSLSGLTEDRSSMLFGNVSAG